MLPFLSRPLSTLHVSVVVGHSQARLVRRVKKFVRPSLPSCRPTECLKTEISCICQHALFTLQIFLSLLSLSILTDTQRRISSSYIHATPLAVAGPYFLG